MCIIVAKHLPSKGWVLAKNRDQDYVSEVTFKDKEDATVGEVLTLYDHDTDYQEGMNHNGMVIITTSLTPNIKDETDKQDGAHIYKALHMDSPEKAANYLIGKLTGYIFIATRNKLILIEAAKRDNGEGAYEYKMRVVPKTETVVRTNHGIEFPWAGFQFGYDKQQDMWRRSSERRKELAEKSTKNATTPEEMLDAMAQKLDNDLQMNQFRVESTPKQMRTIFQWALVPADGVAVIRPIQCEMKTKVNREKLKVKMIDNEPVRKLYNGKIKHFCKIVSDTTNGFIETVKCEHYKRFGTFVKENIDA